MKDIIDSLKIRLNNPLIISFLISWPFWNWEIVVSLIWYNGDNLTKHTEFENFVELIDTYSDNCRSIIFPFVSALAYTFLFPLIKWKINSFTAKYSSREEQEIFEIKKILTVPTVEFVEAVKQADDKIKELSKIITAKSAIHTENTVLKDEKEKLESSIVEKSNDITKLSERITSLQAENAALRESSDDMYLLGGFYVNILYRSINFTFHETLYNGYNQSSLEPVDGLSFKGLSYVVTDAARGLATMKIDMKFDDEKLDEHNDEIITDAIDLLEYLKHPIIFKFDYKKNTFTTLDNSPFKITIKKT